MLDTCKTAQQHSALEDYAGQLLEAIDILKDVTNSVMQVTQTKNPDLVFSNSVAYLDMFGHITISWLWLKQGLVANAALAKQPHEQDEKFYRGKLQAMQYFFRSELPNIYHWGSLVKNIDSTSFDMQADWF